MSYINNCPSKVAANDIGAGQRPEIGPVSNVSVDWINRYSRDIYFDLIGAAGILPKDRAACLGDSQIILKRSLFRVDRTNRWGLVEVGLLAIFVVVGVFRAENEAFGANQAVAVSLLDGRNFDARLLSVGTTEIVVEIDGKKESLATTAISALRFPEATGSNGPGDQIALDKRLLELRDGSKLYGSVFTGKGNNWQFESAVFGKVALPTNSLRYLLFTPLTDETQKTAWDDALSDDASSDALIVVRATGELVRVGGTIREAKAEQINFDFDDQNLEMPLERLKGVSWFQTDKLSKGPAVEVQLRNKSTLQCKSLELTNSGFKLTIGSGVEITVPTDGVSMIQFAAANMRWVAELPLLDASLQSPVPWEFSLSTSKTALLPRYLKYRTSRDSQKTMLPVEEQNLLFAASGSYVFRVPDGFQTLQGTVERPSLAIYRSELLIEVWQEDEKLFSKTLADTEDSMDVNVKVAPEKKTRLSVSVVGQSNLGTEVQWKQVRVLR
ncbi:MAG: hypothetical protein MUC43_02105 [Pirellula sp.]|nr:hypothetical protein [Pirellula sp.]